MFKSQIDSLGRSQRKQIAIDFDDYYEAMIKRLKMKIFYCFNIIANGQIVFSYDKNHGDPVQSIPFGLTIDTDGFLYIAIYYGECVLKVNPTWVFKSVRFNFCTNQRNYLSKKLIIKKLIINDETYLIFQNSCNSTRDKDTGVGSHCCWMGWKESW